MTEPAPAADTIAIADLRPTQMTLGMREVARRQAEIAALSPHKQARYVAERPVPCIRGPSRRLYIIDRHHMCRALLGCGIGEVACIVAADASATADDEFWVYMDLRNWLHPFDADGTRRPVASLPRSVADLVDDPYRALAGFLRRDHGFIKENMPYEEFIWADFLRRRIGRAEIERSYEQAQAAALALARSPAASHLPGYNSGK